MFLSLALVVLSLTYSVAQTGVKIIEYGRYEPNDHGFVYDDVSFKVYPQVVGGSVLHSRVRVVVMWESFKIEGYKYGGEIYKTNPNGGEWSGTGVYLNGQVTKSGKVIQSFTDKLLLPSKYKYCVVYNSDEVPDSVGLEKTRYSAANIDFTSTKCGYCVTEIENYLRIQEKKQKDKLKEEEAEASSGPTYNNNSEEGYTPDKYQNQSKNEEYYIESQKQYEKNQKYAEEKVEEFNQYAEDYNNHWKEQKEKNEALKIEQIKKSEEAQKRGEEQFNQDVRIIKKTGTTHQLAPIKMILTTLTISTLRNFRKSAAILFI